MFAHAQPKRTPMTKSAKGNFLDERECRGDRGDRGELEVHVRRMPIGPVGPPNFSREKASRLTLERAECAETQEDLPDPDFWKDQEVPSKGSGAHGSGKCRPCAWFWKPQGCQNDKDCGYCHLCPEGELKNRKKSKVAAMRMGALVPAKPSQKAKCPSGARVLKLSPLLCGAPGHHPSAEQSFWPLRAALSFRLGLQKQVSFKDTGDRLERRVLCCGWCFVFFSGFISRNPIQLSR
ncbi:unnamed protein product [Symbiodinium pilosum]|uniref:C3H1-type domain-containing protein n=1 Tax=Symbiodinium pilosum TaxID=2952 RepID=A0A812Q310_SYMPI|nr:unnamed protein product [Symbiodinium pilosum]